MDPSQQSTFQGRTRKVDPNRLVERDFSLGYEKSSGFEAVTNFKISVAGYVSEEDHGLPVGFILNAHLEGFGNDDAQQNHLKTFFITKKTLGSQLGIINAFSSSALWIAQTKDPFLPQYIYKLCRSYMQQPVEDRKQYYPVKDATRLVWVPPIVFGATSFSAGVIAMLLPETRGKPLPDFVGKESGGDGKGILSEQKQEFADYTSTV